MKRRKKNIVFPMSLLVFADVLSEGSFLIENDGSQKLFSQNPKQSIIFEAKQVNWLKTFQPLSENPSC